MITSMQQEITAALEEKKRKDEEEEKQKQKELEKKEQMKSQTPAPAQQSGGKQQKEGWLGFFKNLFYSFALHGFLMSFLTTGLGPS